MQPEQVCDRTCHGLRFLNHENELKRTHKSSFLPEYLNYSMLKGCYGFFAKNCQIYGCLLLLPC